MCNVQSIVVYFYLFVLLCVKNGIGARARAHYCTLWETGSFCSFCQAQDWPECCGAVVVSPQVAQSQRAEGHLFGWWWFSQACSTWTRAVPEWCCSACCTAAARTAEHQAKLHKLYISLEFWIVTNNGKYCWDTLQNALRVKNVIVKLKQLFF